MAWPLHDHVRLGNAARGHLFVLLPVVLDDGGPGEQPLMQLAQQALVDANRPSSGGGGARVVVGPSAEGREGVKFP